MTKVSFPFIDKLSLVYSCDSRTGERLLDWIRGIQNDGNYRLYYASGWNRGERYRYNWKLYLGNHRTYFVLIQMHPWIDAGYLRLEWNPNKLGEIANSEVWEFLEILMAGEYEDFLNTVRVTRIDIAIDVTPMTPEAIWVESKLLKNGKVITGGYGRPHSMEYLPVQTICLGDSGSAISFSIYCRNTDALGNIVTSPYVTRIEARMKPSEIGNILNRRDKLHEMWDLQNPFERLSIIRSVDPFELDSASDVERLVIASCRSIGYHAALRLIRDSRKRGRIRNQINQYLAEDWFDPGQIWSRYPQALRSIMVPPSVRTPEWIFVDGRWIRIRRRSA